MKDELALYGGEPIRKDKIFYGRQCIENDDVAAVSQTLLSNFITCGPMVEKFEEKLCEYTKAQYAVAVCNGTAALHCACLAAGIGEGDEVITTPMTFAASANCILYCGATPVFADICLNTYNIDPISILSKITPKTKAIIAVDFTGQIVEAEKIRKICDDHHLIFIEDASHSIATTYKGKPVGSIADLTTFSFHPVKTITGGEGGAILTNNEEFYNKLVLAHTHGITHDKRMMENCDHEGPWYYEQIALGYNYRLTDFQASLLISQLGKIERFKRRRKEIVKMYDMTFREMPEIIVQDEIADSDTCRHLYIIRLDLMKLTCTRREFFDAMSAENVQCQVHYVPVYWFPYYQHLGYKMGICQNAEEVYRGIMSIPLYPMLSDNDVNDVIKAVTKIVDYFKR